MLYNMKLDGDILCVGFGDPASNDEVVKEVSAKAHDIRDQVHGKVIKINGVASLPVATVIAHELGHVVAALAVYDPKLVKYVVTISHDKNFSIGDLIE